MYGAACLTNAYKTRIFQHEEVSLLAALYIVEHGRRRIVVANDLLTLSERVRHVEIADSA